MVYIYIYIHTYIYIHVHVTCMSHWRGDIWDIGSDVCGVESDQGGRRSRRIARGFHLCIVHVPVMHIVRGVSQGDRDHVYMCMFLNVHLCS